MNRRSSTVLALVALLLVGGFSTPSTADEVDPFTWKWYELDENQQLQMYLFVFTRDTCQKCPKALAWVQALNRRYSWLRVRQYEIGKHPGNLELYRRMAASVKRPAGQVPAVFYCRQLTVGYTSDATTGKQIEEGVLRCYDYLRRQLPSRSNTTAPPPDLGTADSPAAWPGVVRHLAWGLTTCWNVARSDPHSWQNSHHLPDGGRGELLARADRRASAAAEFDGSPDELQLELPPAVDEMPSVELPLVGSVDTDRFSLPVLTAVLAGCDAFNPCAFFVLLSLLGLLVHAHSRRRMLLVGGVFVFFSGLFYFAFMAAWLNLFFLAGHLDWITTTAGLLAVAVAFINIKDYFWLRRGISLSIPEQAKPRLFDRMRGLVTASGWLPLLLGTTALAMAANSYELLCTAGFPMVFTRILTLHELPVGGYYSYLVLYNLIYVIPLALIVVAFTFTLGRRKLSEREGRILKLLSGIMMLCLGLILLVAPERLHQITTALGLLAVAVGVTTVILGWERWRWHRARQVRVSRAVGGQQPAEDTVSSGAPRHS